MFAIDLFLIFMFISVFSACDHWWICLLVWLLSFIYLFLLFFVLSFFNSFTLFYLLSFFSPFSSDHVADRVLVFRPGVRPEPPR